MKCFGILQAVFPARGSRAEAPGSYVPPRTWRWFHAHGRKQGLQVLFFRAEDVEFRSRRVHAWTCSSPDGLSGWSRGWHPLPDVLYENYPIGSNGKSKHAIAVKRAFVKMGVPVFNPVFFNKAQLHARLSAVPAVRPFLPVSRVARHASDAADLLRQHRCVYLKPVNGYQGRGILELRMLSSGRVQVLAGKRAGRQPLREEWGWPELRPRLTRLFRKRTYLVQEGLRLIRRGDRKIDFRVVVHRGADGRWHSAGIRPKLGRAGSIVTDSHAGGSKTTWRELQTWARRAGAPLPSAKELVKPAIKAAQALTAARPTLSHLGIDVAVDEKRRIYLLDINEVPGRDLLTTGMLKRVTHLTAGFASYLAYRSSASRRT
ncbi:hypothetical protein J31TS4_28040 [Paenibacillus sp. J31TS4]|uniref:YheC/YheD family endospore coat-associated protein n=1 Tax=Paenibacillus sp. J31TS4 TaxID=2807195 RepID=UPI001B1406D6|nr:YheC/YheD family protein [Paenibacillus sp. J31TS4]GIP39524.1 hypothetical protein J31TS4_28040 [Paenibacillus sp. J31TS4]